MVWSDFQFLFLNNINNNIKIYILKCIIIDFYTINFNYYKLLIIVNFLQF